MSDETSTNTNKMENTTTGIRDQVSQRYGEIAETGGASCCASNASEQGMKEHAEAIGYSADDLSTLPDGANLGLGCGSPTTLTMIKPGMTVLDLGSGAGVDCFLASPKVGDAGKVIGVDMTDEMLAKASAFAQEHDYKNVDFRKGLIEQLPVEDSSVDLVISNCVVNLSPEKDKVFAEIARVLKPGGQAAISDIVLLDTLPESVLKDVEAYIGCISGAVMIGDYIGMAMLAGMNVGRADRKSYDVLQVLGCSPEAGKLLEDLPEGFDGNQYVASLDLLLEKPATSQVVSSECAPGSGCC